MNDPRHDAATHPIDPSLVSAYYDDLLTTAERHVVEEHLTTCSACRGRLDGYAALGHTLRADREAPVPEALDRRFAALMQNSPLGWSPSGSPSTDRSSSRGLGWLRPFRTALVATTLVGLLVATLLFGLPFGDFLGGPPTATAYPCDEQSECDVMIEFTGTIDRANIEQTIRIEPAVSFSTSWRGDTLLIKLQEPPPPAETYTVRLQAQKASDPPNTQANPATPTPLELHVAAPKAATQAIAASAISPSPSPAATTLPPTSTPEIAMAVEATSTPTSTPTTTETPCAITPVRGFGTLYQNQPEVALRLGCAVETERAVALVMQQFENGQVLWRNDRDDFVALFADGRWQSYPTPPAPTESATAAPSPTGTPMPALKFERLLHDHPELRDALGAATTPERPLQGAAETFQYGNLIWSADQIIYVMYADGAWEQYADTFRDPTATPTPAAGTPPVVIATPTGIVTPGTATPTPPPPPPTPTPAVSGTPTPTDGATPSPPPSGTPADSPTPASCAIQPVRGFGLVYGENPAVAEKLGCARDPERGLQFGWQEFEHGLVVWYRDQRTIFALHEDGTWSVYLDTWREGEPLNAVETPPAGLLPPGRAIGKLWRQNQSFRQEFGWPINAEEARASAIEEFTNGWMLWSDHRIIYVLYADGTWESFDDRFVDPTPTPSRE